MGLKTQCCAQVMHREVWTPARVTVADHWSVSSAASGIWKASAAGGKDVELRTAMEYMLRFASLSHGSMRR